MKSKANRLYRKAARKGWSFLVEHRLPVLIIAVFLVLHRVTPLPPAGEYRDFYEGYVTIASIGLVLSIIMSFFVMFVAGTRLQDNQVTPHYFSELINMMGWCAAFIGLPAIVVRISVEPLLNAYRQNSQSIISLSVAFAIFLLFMNFGQHWLNRHHGHKTMNEGMFSGYAHKVGDVSGEPDENSRRRQRRVAIHEAGHALCYAALNRLPDDLELRVKRISEPLGGYVQGSAIFRGAPNVLEWQMQLKIAGVCAEMLLTGRYNIGSYTDFAHWHEVANWYLKHQYEGIYFPQPVTELELAHNVEMLHKLLLKHLAKTRNFLEQNQGVLEELANLAAENEILNKGDLEPFLARVKLTDDFPRIEPSDWVKDDGSLGAYIDGMRLND